jgi:beta-phosphoglucomutase-like phosphatase (HAD superfamily)
MAFQGAIFDVDGVLVDSPHERAWREALNGPFGKGLWEQARSAKPDFIVCDSETCRWHIAAATGLPVYHPVQVLDRAYRA